MPHPKLLLLEDGVGVAGAEIQTRSCLIAKPPRYSLSHAAPLNYCFSRMGLVWRMRRLAASVWAELILWSLWSLVVLFSIGLPIYLGSSYLGEPTPLVSSS